MAALLLAQRHCLKDGQYVLLHRHLAKDGLLLREVPHTQPGAFVHRIASHIGSGKDYPAAIWPNESDDHVKAGRLASTVLAEQPDNFSLPHLQFHPVYDSAAAIDLDQILRDEDLRVFVRQWDRSSSRAGSRSLS